MGICTCLFVCESWCLCRRHQANKQQLGTCISMSVLPNLNPAQWEMCSGLQRDEFLWESVLHNRTPSSHCCHARETWDLHKQLQQLYFSYSVLSWTACGRRFERLVFRTVVLKLWSLRWLAGARNIIKLRWIIKQTISNFLCCRQKKCIQV